MNKLMHKRGRRKPIGSLIIVTVVRSLQAIHCNNIIANLILAQKLKPKIQVLLLFFFILQFKIKQIKSIMKPNLNNYEQLLRINKELQKKLNEAQIEITSLREENFQLKQRLAVYENQQSTVHNIGQASDEEEVFTSSSGQDSEQYQAQFQNLNEEAEEMPQKKNNFYDQQYPQNPIMTPISVTKTAQRVLSHPKVIFNYQSEGSQVPKLLMKQPKKQLIKQNSDQSQQNNENRWGNVSVEHSAIKFQEPIMARNNSSIFQRVKNSNKIYDYFFVTGYSFKQNSRAVQYCYPSQSEHFSAILSLIYTENSLRSIDTSSNMSKSPRSANIKYGKLSVKDSFVMIIYKQKLFQRQYLFACQVEDVLEAPDHSLYIFNRLFCFITSCSFFSVYKKIIEQFINKINSSNHQVKITSPLNQNTTKQLLSGLLEEHLKILFEKNVKENQYVNFGLGNQINIFIDVPSASESYRNLLQYRPWGILFCPIYLSYQAQQIKQKELFGFLLTYMLTQTKIMLYSMVKSKVSEAVLHALQMIKPLEYVNPIIMATIKDEHQQYFNAPMSIILGLWGQPKQKRKQKIEIFMNKKPSMMGLTSLIQQNKANELDGVIFNLDTGQTCGGGITNEKNKIAIQLNCLIQNSCKSSKEKYKLIQNLLIRRTNLESLQMRELSDRLLNEIKNTQLYSFYLQKSTTMHL